MSYDFTCQLYLKKKNHIRIQENILLSVLYIKIQRGEVHLAPLKEI